MLRLLLPTVLVLTAAGHKAVHRDNVVGLESKLVELAIDKVAESLDEVLERGGRLTKANIKHLTEQALLKQMTNMSSTTSTCTELTIIPSGLQTSKGSLPSASYICPSVLDQDNILPISASRSEKYYASQDGSTISMTRMDCWATNYPTDQKWEISSKCFAPDISCYSTGWPSCCWDSATLCSNSPNSDCTGAAVTCDTTASVTFHCCEVGAAALSGVYPSLLSKYSKVLVED